jgi:hypothetical protein
MIRGKLSCSGDRIHPPIKGSGVVTKDDGYAFTM